MTTERDNLPGEWSVDLDRLQPGDLVDPKTVRNPFPLYQALRPASPRQVGGAGGVWVVMRHADVLAVTSDASTYSSVSESASPVMHETPIIFEDPPSHTLHRRLVSKAFTPGRIAELEPWIAKIVAELLDGIGAGPVEIASTFCARLPVKVIAHLMGVPSDDDATLKRWADHRSALIGYSGSKPESAEAAQRLEEAAEGNRRLLELFQRLLDERRSAPGSDLVSLLARAEVDGESLSDKEVVGICALLLTAGNVTTTNLLGNLFSLLADDRDLYVSLRTNRQLVEPVIEETLRRDSPVQWLFRRATRDVELGGARIKAGDPLIVYFGAANRDPAVHDEPDAFRLDRATTGHLAFGYGIHFCLGAPLARLEARTALNIVLDRYTAIERGAEPAVRLGAGPTHYGFASLPLVLRP